MSSTSTATVASGRSVWDGGVSPFGASYGKLMMWFFLLSDALTFSGLLVTYALSRFSHGAFKGTVDTFFPSQSYWPIAEKVFTHIPFFHVSAPLALVGLMTFI